MDIADAFWNRVDAQLNLYGITVADLWRKIKKPANTGNGWRKNHRIPTGDVCCKIARVLNTTTEFLVTGEDVALPGDDYTGEKETVCNSIALIANPRLARIISKLSDATERQLVAIEVALGLDEEKRGIEA